MSIENKLISFKNILLKTKVSKTYSLTSKEHYCQLQIYDYEWNA